MSSPKGPRRTALNHSNHTLFRIIPCACLQTMFLKSSVIRRITATFLLLCMALLVPASASSVRVCFIEEAVLLPGWDAERSSDSEKPKCCPGCDGKEDGHCCMELKKLPDAPEPSVHIFLSPVFFCLATSEVCVPPCPVLEACRSFLPSAPIRGPDLPREWRALLGVWNI